MMRGIVVEHLTEVVFLIGLGPFTTPRREHRMRSATMVCGAVGDVARTAIPRAAVAVDA
jgi:hypothetical protein